MLILGIDSSTKAGTVSLITEDKLVGETMLNLDQTHSQRLMPQIISLMEDCHYQPQDLTGIGVTQGPGSFTGTRIGMATAKTLAHSLELPIVGVSTLKVLAYSLQYGAKYICSVIDARGGRVFACLYRAADQLEQETEEAVMEIDNLLSEVEKIDKEIYFVGNIVANYQSKIEERVAKARFVTNLFNLPRAGAVAELAAERLKDGSSDQVMAITPNYLKRSQAEIQWEQRQD